MATPDLLGMPREVLDRILRDCLVAGIVAQKDSFPSFAKFEIAVPILRTCKIIYEARLPILYGENIFYFYRFLELKSWLGKQRIYNKGMIKHVLVLHNVGAGNDRVKPWVALPGLRSYNILEPGLSHEPEMPGLTFMRRMWRKEQPVDIGVVTLDNGSCPPALVSAKFETSKPLNTDRLRTPT